jgi:hypothetical protein
MIHRFSQKSELLQPLLAVIPPLLPVILSFTTCLITKAILLAVRLRLVPSGAGDFTSGVIPHDGELDIGHAASSAGHASLYDVPQDNGDASGVATSGLGALTAGEIPAEASVAGSDDSDGEDYAWIDQWMEDGGDAAGFWAAPSEAGPLTGGILGAPIGAEALSAGVLPADGVVAVGVAIAADEPASMSDLAQTNAAEGDTEGEELAAVGGTSSFAESMNLGMWSLSYD